MKTDPVRKYSISFAGAGRLAGNLCTALHDHSHTIDLVVSESAARGPGLAYSCCADWSDTLKFPAATDIIIVCVPDSKLEKVLKSIECSESTVVVHTSGTMGLDVFPAKIRKRGVFYPLQTFSHDRKADFKELTFYVESRSKKIITMLAHIASSLDSKISYANTSERRMMHLAAVFANNFTNHMLTISNVILNKSGLYPEILEPLIRETFSKAIELGPLSSQTGPAVRNDKNTIGKHLELLSFNRDLQKLYKEISSSVSKYHNGLS